MLFRGFATASIVVLVSTWVQAQADRRIYLGVVGDLHLSFAIKDPALFWEPDRGRGIGVYSTFDVSPKLTIAGTIGVVRERFQEVQWYAIDPDDPLIVQGKGPLSYSSLYFSSNVLFRPVKGDMVSWVAGAGVSVDGGSSFEAANPSRDPGLGVDTETWNYFVPLQTGIEFDFGLNRTSLLFEYQAGVRGLQDVGGKKYRINTAGIKIVSLFGFARKE
jgi:hypothetical protein